MHLHAGPYTRAVVGGLRCARMRVHMAHSECMAAPPASLPTCTWPSPYMAHMPCAAAVLPCRVPSGSAVASGGDGGGCMAGELAPLPSSTTTSCPPLTSCVLLCCCRQAWAGLLGASTALPCVLRLWATWASQRAAARGRKVRGSQPL